MSLEKYKQVFGEFAIDVDFMDGIIKSLDLDQNSKILDIGTGFGAMSILLAMNGFIVMTGQPQHDPHWEEHEEHHLENDTENEHHHAFPVFDWKENARSLLVEDKIKFQYLDAEALNFPNESIDAIFMFDTLQHVKNREVSLNECIRVIRKSGLICVIEWTKKSIKETEEKEGFTIDYIDPREILNRDDVSVELHSSEWVNSFIIRKKLKI